MSITDSSTALDTAYTEQSLVAFTGGVLTTLADCVAEVESKLHKGTLSTSTTPTLAQVQGWLKRAKMELAESRKFSFNRKYASLSTVPDQFRYSLPPDYAGGRTILRDITNDRFIMIKDQHQFDAKFPDPSFERADEPEIATFKNMEMWLMPKPNGIFTPELEYDRSGAETTADDFAWLPEIERWRCCDFALSESFEALHNWGVAKIYRSKWEYDLKKASKADGKKRWKSMHYQAISLPQEYNMLGNQPRSDRFT